MLVATVCLVSRFLANLLQRASLAHTFGEKFQSQFGYNSFLWYVIFRLAVHKKTAVTSPSHDQLAAFSVADLSTDIISIGIY